MKKMIGVAMVVITTVIFTGCGGRDKEIHTEEENNMVERIE